MSDDLLRYRSEFPILERTTYLISNSLGAMPRGVYDSMHKYAELWATRGIRAWDDAWWMLAMEVGNQIGALMNAPKDSVALHGNVTQCQATVASCRRPRGPRCLPVIGLRRSGGGAGLERGFCLRSRAQVVVRRPRNSISVCSS